MSQFEATGPQTKYVYGKWTFILAGDGAHLINPRNELVDIVAEKTMMPRNNQSEASHDRPIRGLAWVLSHT